MKTMGVLVGSALFAVLLVTPVHAQQPAGPHDHASPPAVAPPAPRGGPHAGMKGPGMPMMDMCRDMMGGMTAMAAMTPSAPTDPNERAAMMEMHGEMMKAMGDIMMKHAQRMHGAPAK